MTDFRDEERQDAIDEDRTHRRYKQALSRHPDCRDPDHPGCDICEEHVTNQPEKMTMMTEEERARLCVAKFRDMPDDMLSEMPGTVLQLADECYKTSNKLRKISDLFLEVVEHLPVDVMRHVMAELSAYLVTSGEKTMSEVIADIEASRDKMEKK